MKSSTEKKPHGRIRQSQLITTFGPGSVVDLPHYSVMIGGLEYWNKGPEIIEPRMTDKLRRDLLAPTLKLFSPPPAEDDYHAPLTGITCLQFPEWFITQDTNPMSGMTRSRLLIHRKALTKGKYKDGKKTYTVVPMRFVRACRRGHIGDIDWIAFVHNDMNAACRRQLRIDERGTSGDLSEIVVRCECGCERLIADATIFETKALGLCRGDRPWLGAYSSENCGEPNRLLIRTASNAYFPQILSVISLPEKNEPLTQAVEQLWEPYLQYVEALEDIEYEKKKKPPVRNLLEDYTNDEVYAEVQRRKGGSVENEKSVKQAELETLLDCKEEIGTDRPDGNFFARALPKTSWSSTLMKDFECITLVHRLREIIALVGFTRFEPTAPDVEGELDLGVKRAPLSNNNEWLPAVENKGEGVFIALKKTSIQSWLAKPEVTKRGDCLNLGCSLWKKDHPQSKRSFIGLPYVFLHSLSHLLITSVSLECGYPASSIRERIYANDSGYGILLYTGSSDSEGTMGGLVEVGRRFEKHLAAALEIGKLCANDPVCAQHDPSNIHEGRFLHGAACHGCLLIAETACEQRNEFLDRALVIPTIVNHGAEFFNV